MREWVAELVLVVGVVLMVVAVVWSFARVTCGTPTGPAAAHAPTYWTKGDPR